MPSAASVMRAAVLAGVASAMPELAPRQMVTSSCADVHIFLGKGNNEPYPGRQGKLVSAICDGLPSCDYEDIQMQNMLPDEYCGSVTQGTTNGRAQIIAYNQRCPNSKLVVSGFSQGGQVVGDIFSGAGATLFQGCVEPYVPALDRNSPAGQQIAAILTFGDVRHTAFQPYGYKSGANGWGLFPRSSEQLASALNFAGVWRDYCNGGDPVCAGGQVVDEHLNYFDVDTPDAAAWVKEMIKNFRGPVKTNPDDSKPTAGPTSSRSPYSNSTMTTGNAVGPTTAVVTVDNTVYTTVCPYPTDAVKPPYHSVVVPSPLPEATCETTENLSAVPTTAKPTAPTGTGSVVKPTPSVPGVVVSGSSANAAQLGFFGLAGALAAFALL